MKLVEWGNVCEGGPQRDKKCERYTKRIINKEV